MKQFEPFIPEYRESMSATLDDINKLELNDTIKNLILNNTRDVIFNGNNAKKQFIIDKVTDRIKNKYYLSLTPFNTRYSPFSIYTSVEEYVMDKYNLDIKEIVNVITKNSYRRLDNDNLKPKLKLLGINIMRCPYIRNTSVNVVAASDIDKLIDSYRYFSDNY